MQDLRVEVDVDSNLRRLLRQEDLDQDYKITVDDHGPYAFQLIGLDDTPYEISGHYYLSNLLEILGRAHVLKQKTCVIHTKEIFENPVDHYSKLIRKKYWDDLTRTLDEKGLLELFEDSKVAKNRRLYVPSVDKRALKHYEHIQSKHPYLHLEICPLKSSLSLKDHEALDHKPGVLALSLKENGTGYPFVVPGGRFNEMYGWDSYFILCGLLEDKRLDLAMGLLENAMYQIEHYGALLNGNRSYYLSRSQPPLFSSMVMLMARSLPEEEASAWIKRPLSLAIKEYEEVWLSDDRLTENGLSRYYGKALKEPIEVEEGHFDEVYEKYAKDISLDQYRKKYLNGEIENTKLDEYFIHDRAMRESGHDTTRRLIGVCADLNTVDLNSLLYKMEMDISSLIQRFTEDVFLDLKGDAHNSEYWISRAAKRKKIMMDLMWSEEDKLFYDYNFKLKKQAPFACATTFYPLFAGLVTPAVANEMIEEALPLFEEPGGLVATTEKSRGPLQKNMRQCQWDYPFGWAPHQMIFWEGASKYGFKQVARRLAYRWLFMVIQEAMNYGGVLAEKYDVVKRTHQALAEYGNVGTDFKYYPDGGFGWVNASIQVGLSLLSPEQIQMLKDLSPPEWVFKQKTEHPE